MNALRTPTVALGDVAPITDVDLNWWIDKIHTLDWVFAVTYADGAPHEYVCDRTEGMDIDDFERASRVIQTFGEPQRFYKRTRTYLVHDGWKYWTMDDDHRKVTLVNRGRSHHNYGVQNAPKTRSAATTAYDPIATYWDECFSLSNEESKGFTALVDSATGGFRKCRTLDLGAGTGTALDLGLTDSFRLTAIDPSGPMLNVLVAKHPLVARVEAMTFRTAREHRVLGGTKFDLVLALGGAGSYLSKTEWDELPKHAKGRYVMSVFAEGEAPVTQDLSTDDLLQARSNVRSFASEHNGLIHRVGRFEVLVAHG